MRTRVLHLLFVLLFAGGSGAAARPSDEVQLTPPPALVESLAWHQDPESVLRAFRVPKAPADAASGARAHAGTAPRTAAGVTTSLGRRPSALTDVPVAADAALIETQPSVTASPGRQDLLAAAYVAAAFPTSPGTRCFVARSLNLGRTWTRKVQLPTLSPTSNCGDPALAYSPDGKHLYAAYRDILSTQEFLPDDPTLFKVETATHIVVSRSRDDGRTWSAPAMIRVTTRSLSSAALQEGGLVLVRKALHGRRELRMRRQLGIGLDQSDGVLAGLNDDVLVVDDPEEAER